MNQVAKLGHNNPPDPFDEICDEFADTFAEVSNWLDGTSVENEGQMKAVDALLATIKQAEARTKDAKEHEYRPHKDACDAVVARWKPLVDDLDRMRKGLAVAVSKFKAKIAAEKDAERRAAERAAREAREAAEKAAHDPKRQSEASALQIEAIEAQKAAQAVEKVKGLRTYTVPEIIDAKACLNWIAQNDREAVVAFMDEYVAKAVRGGNRSIAGVEVRREKRAV